MQIGVKVVSHGRYVAFQMAEVAVSRNLFVDILRLIAELRPRGQVGSNFASGSEKAANDRSRGTVSLSGVSPLRS
jgi:hypothetical protein